VSINRSCGVVVSAQMSASEPREALNALADGSASQADPARRFNVTRTAMAIGSNPLSSTIQSCQVEGNPP
jgi:hypothetical protein